MTIVIPMLVILASFFLYQRRNRNVFGPVSLVLVAYLVMTMIAVGLHLALLGFSSFRIQIEPMLYLSAMLTLGFSGFWRFKDAKFLVVEIENYVVYRVFETFLIVWVYTPFRIV